METVQRNRQYTRRSVRCRGVCICTPVVQDHFIQSSGFLKGQRNMAPHKVPYGYKIPNTERNGLYKDGMNARRPPAICQVLSYVIVEVDWCFTWYYTGSVIIFMNEIQSFGLWSVCARVWRRKWARCDECDMDRSIWQWFDYDVSHTLLTRPHECLSVERRDFSFNCDAFC